MRALTPTAAYLQRFSSSLSAKKSTKQPIEEAKTPRKKTSADVDAATKAAVSASKAKAPAQSKSKATKILEEAVSEMKVDTVSSRSIDVEEKKKEKSAVKGNSKKASAESVRKSTAKDASAAKGIQKKGQKDARKTVAKVDKIAESVGGNAPGKSESGKEVETKNNAKADARQEEAEQPSKKKVEFLFPELRVMVKNTQSRIPVDVDAVAKQAHKIKSILKVEDFQVGVKCSSLILMINFVLASSYSQLDIWFCSDDKIRDLNEEWRGKRKSTDILSFPANEVLLYYTYTYTEQHYSNGLIVCSLRLPRFLQSQNLRCLSLRQTRKFLEI